MSDYVERQAVLDALQAPEICNITPRHIELVKQIPSARVAPVRYACLYLNKHYGDYECSACGKGDIIRISSRNSMIGYCPYCGAKFTDRIGFKNKWHRRFNGGAGA